MSSLVNSFWNNIGEFLGEDFGIGTFGNGGKSEIGYRHYYEVKNLKNMINFNNDMIVLELGCGSGRFANSIAPLVKKYVGIDYSEKAIELAQKKCNFNNIEFIVGSAIDFNVNEKFDVIYLGSVIQYLSDKEIKYMLKNLKKYIKEDTIIMDRSSICNEVRHVADSILYYCTYRTPNELKKLFKEINYDLVERKTSYRFLRFGTFFNKHINKVYKFSPISFKFMNLMSLYYDKFIYNYKSGNYESHDFFLYKKISRILY